jgi:hypothetical protein
MTSSQIDYLFIIPSVLLIIVPLWDLITNTSQIGFKRITKIGWMLFILSMIFAGLSFAKIYVQSVEKNGDKKTADSTRNADKIDLRNSVDNALKKYGLTIKSDSKIIRIVDTTKQIDPIMDAGNPQILGTSLDSLKVEFDIVVINGGIAFNVRDKFIYFAIVNNSFRLIKITNRAINESTVDYNKNGSRISIPLTISRSNNADSTYFYLKVLYSNKAINGHDQPPIKKIFLLSLKHVVKSTADITGFKEIDNQDKYNYIKNKLIASGNW